MAIILILLLALIVRLIQLGQSFWLDETVQAIEISSQWSNFPVLILGDFHPPLYYYFLHFWSNLVGMSEIALRLPSVIFAVGSVYLIYLLGKKINGNNTGLIAALLLALSQFHIYYSQEARMYSPVTFLALLSWWSLLKTEESKKYWFIYLISTAGALYTDYFAFFVWLSQIAYFLWLYKTKILRQKSWFLTNAFIFLSLLPWIPSLLLQIETGRAMIEDLPLWPELVNLPVLKIIPLTFAKFSLGRITLENKFLYAGLAGFAALLYLFTLVKALLNFRKNIPPLVFYFFIPLILSILISLSVPSYQPFRLLLILPGLLLLVAVGLSSMKKVQFAVIFDLIIFLNLFSLMLYWQNPSLRREEWRQTFDFLKQNNHQNDPILYYSESIKWPCLYYAPDLNCQGIISELKINEPQINSRLENLAGEQKRGLWLIHYLQPVFDPENLIINWFEKNGYAKIKNENFNGIEIWHYENRH